MFRIIPHNMVAEFEGHPEQIQRMIDGLKAKRTGADGPKRAEIDANISMLKTKLEDAKKIKWGKDGKIVKESAIDDEDVHLQSAHDALSSRITKCKREGKDCKALEARLSNIAALLKKA
jgi:hypothetical protein